jgi:hypothetical protein
MMIYLISTSYDFLEKKIIVISSFVRSVQYQREESVNHHCDNSHNIELFAQNENKNK